MPSLKKLVIIIGTMRLGGAQQQAINFAYYLKIKNLYAPIVIGLDIPGEASNLMDRLGIPWKLVYCNISHDPWKFLSRSLAGIIKAWFAIWRERPFIIYSFMEQPNILGAIIWKFAGSKLFIWGQRNDGAGLRCSWLERFAVNQVPLFIANSVIGKEGLIKKMNVSHSKVAVIPNGLFIQAPDCSRQKVLDRYHIPQNAFVVVMTANITRYKDHRTAVLAWNEVVRTLGQKTSSVLMFIGKEGNEFENVKKLCVELNISKHVRFTGFAKNVYTFLSIADLGLFCQREEAGEGTPNAILEYMMAELPVVASDIRSIRPLLSIENLPFLCPPSDYKMHAAMMLKLFEDQRLRKYLGKKNKDCVADRYSLETMGGNTIDVINENL